LAWQIHEPVRQIVSAMLERVAFRLDLDAGQTTFGEYSRRHDDFFSPAPPRRRFTALGRWLIAGLARAEPSNRMVAGILIAYWAA